MKRITIIICILLILVSAVLIPIRGATAKDNKTPFSGTKWITYLVPGAYTYPDGTIHVRDQYMEFLIDTDESRMAGVEKVVANANWNADGIGPVWGTFRLDVAPGSYWEGTFLGKLTEDGVFIKQVGVGKGDLNGLTMRAAIYLDSSTYNGVIEGVIIEHGQ